jgi:membrane protein required for colicin V production
VTLFDLIAIVILLVSGLVGFTRGAVRELVTVFAFTLSAMAAVYLLPVAGPLFRDLMRPAWAANAAAVVTVFIVAYIALRILGHMVTSHLRAQAVLGTVDRLIGLAFGVVRALVFLGVFYLVFNLATPPELVPQWMSKAKLYPVARASARVLQTVAPKRLTSYGRFGPALERVVKDGSEPENSTSAAEDTQNGAPTTQSPRRNPPHTIPGYDKRSRDDIDALVERTR